MRKKFRRNRFGLFIGKIETEPVRPGNGPRMKKKFSLEIEVLEGEVDFDDAGGLDSRSEDVLLSRLVVLGAKPVQVVQETAKEQDSKSVLAGAIPLHLATSVSL